MPALKEKVAIITGGSSGIGLAIAKCFVSEGAYVFITSRRQSELDKAVAEIGKNVTAIQGDVSKLEDLDRLYSAVSSKGRKIDVVVANAGFVEMGPIATATPEFFDRTFDTNARGAFFTVQKALPLMNDGGSIILITSAGKNKATPGRSAYSGTKAALRSFVRTWTMELKDRGIRSNVLSPGSHRNTDPRRLVRLERGYGSGKGAIRKSDSAWQDGPARGDCCGSAISGVKRGQLYYRH